jgi:hypothetical protein
MTIVRPISNFILSMLLLTALAASAGAQQPSSPKEDPPSSEAGSQPGKPEVVTPEIVNDDQSQISRTGTSKDRLFFVLPNFLTLENASHVPPMTAGQKFTALAKTSFDWAEYPWYGFLAGISQAENSEPGYGQGAEGYAKRYGAAFADGTIENFWTGALLPTVFREDPRFYQLGEGGFGRRAIYAVSRIFITRTDSGHSDFNYSEVFGSAISAGISTYSYHPKADRTISNTASVWASEVGYDMLTIVVKEFWPDIRRKIIHK